MTIVAKKCSALNCAKPSESRELCGMHYARWLRHGHILQTRPSIHGAKNKHPLHETWRTIKRNKSGSLLCDRWKDFWNFVEDVKERPSKDVVFKRIDETKLYSSDNYYWRDFTNGIEQRSEHAEYAKRFYKRRCEADPWFKFSQDLKKHYGLTVDQYISMLDAQDGKCAICKCEERSVDQRTGRIRKLAVDHDHITGQVRDLLCSHCNSGLGQFGDNIENLQKAITYLQKHTHSAEIIPFKKETA